MTSYLDKIHCSSMAYGEYEFPDLSISEFDPPSLSAMTTQRVLSNVSRLVHTSEKLIEPAGHHTVKIRSSSRSQSTPSQFKPEHGHVQTQTVMQSTVHSVTDTCHHHGASDLHETMILHPQQFEKMFTLPDQRRKHGEVVKENNMRSMSAFIGPMGAYYYPRQESEARTLHRPKCDKDQCHHDYEILAGECVDDRWSARRLTRQERLQYEERVAPSTSGMLL